MAMKRGWMVSVAAVVALAGSGAAMLIVTNPAPAMPAMPTSEAIDSVLPYVVKLHAQWCPVCMVTKAAWASVQESYAGKVRLVVFDFTNRATTEASEALARKLGLDQVFDQYAGETGTVLVLDGLSKTVRSVLHGSRDPGDYRAAIDAALADTWR